MRIGPGIGENLIGNIRSTTKLIALFLIFITAGILLGCNQENQTRNNDESTTVDVNRKTKSSKLAFRSASGNKEDRKSGRITSSPLNRQKLSVISGENQLVLSSSRSEISRPTRTVNNKVVPNTVALAKFYTALYEIEAGVRSRPVTILHIGSDRISRDGFSGDLRIMFQGRFGSAGRGMMSPGLTYPSYRADGVRISQTGNWISLNSVNGDAGFFGLAGVLKQTYSANSTLTMKSSNELFTWAEVSFISGPDQGSAEISITGADKITKKISLISEVPQLKRIRLIAKGRELRITSLSDRPLTISSWSLGEDRTGVRYVNFGLPGATAGHADLLDVSIVKDELDILNPNLIIFDYGEIESQNDALDITEFEKRLNRIVNVFADLSPNSSIVVIGVKDINRLPEQKSTALSEASGWACRNLSSHEQENYLSLVQRGDTRLNRWHPPPNLKSVRQVQFNVASSHGGYFWDWSKFMGGACGMHAWVHTSPSLATENHLRLTVLGLRKSARALFSEIISGYSEYRRIARR